MDKPSYYSSTLMCFREKPHSHTHTYTTPLVQDRQRLLSQFMLLLYYTYHLCTHIKFYTCTSVWSWSTIGTPLISRISSPIRSGLAFRYRGSLKQAQLWKERMMYSPYINSLFNSESILPGDPLTWAW